MFIPYYVLLLVYFVMCLAGFVALCFNLYHMVRWGLFNFTGKLNTGLLLGVMVIVFVVTAVLLRDIDWTSDFSLFDLTSPYSSTPL